MKSQNTHAIQEDSWLNDLVFYINIIAQSTDLNLKLKCKNILIALLNDEIKWSITKLTCKCHIYHMKI